MGSKRPSPVTGTPKCERPLGSGLSEPSGTCGSDAGDAPGFHVLVAPVTAFQAGDGHFATGAGCVQEASLAHVDPDVVHALAVVGAEEDQVAWRQVGAIGNQLAAVGHVARDARQFDSERAAEHVTDQAAAIEAV